MLPLQCNQHNYWDILHSLFGLNLRDGVHILHLKHISLKISHIQSAQSPLVASDSCTEPLGLRNLIGCRLIVFILTRNDEFLVASLCDARSLLQSLVRSINSLGLAKWCYFIILPSWIIGNTFLKGYFQPWIIWLPEGTVHIEKTR